MLTTTLDGLWALQVCSGVEQLCPELGLRPTLPRLETKDKALAHPIAAELIEIGAMDVNGEVDEMIRQWLTVIMRRDVAVMVQMARPDAGGFGSRTSISRFDQWWVSLERADQMVRLSPVGTATTEAAAGELLVGAIERLCGVNTAASLRPVTLDTEALLASVRDAGSLRSFLIAQGLDAEQISLLQAAADPAKSSQASIVAMQAGVGPDTTARVKVGATAVTLADTPAGRLCVENIDSGGRRFQTVSPGTRSDIAAAITRLIRRLPAGAEWFSHRRAV